MIQRRCRASAVLALVMMTACESQPNPTATSSPAGEHKSFKETLKEEAGKVADAAREGASEIAASAKEVAHVAKEEALQIAAAARDLARSTKEQSVAAAQHSMEEGRRQLAILRDQKDRIEESLRPEYERAMAELSERIDSLKSRAVELKDAAPDAWRNTVQELAPLVVDIRTRVHSAWGEYVQGGRVHGSVTYLERMLLPDGAELRVRLLDISKSDSRAEIVTEQTVQLTGAPPFSFDLRFDPAKVHPQGAYAVEAEIQVGGKRHFSTPEPKRVTISDSATDVAIIVKRTE